MTRTLQWLFFVSVLLFISGIGFVIAAGRTVRAAAPAAAPAAPAVPEIASVKYVMRGITMPSAAAIWDSVSTIVDATGVLRERARVPGKWVTAAVGDAERLAYASGRTVWLETQRSRRTLLHERSVKGLALSEDGSLLAVVQADRVSVHDARLEDIDAEPLQLEWKDVHLAATLSPDLRFIVVTSPPDE